MFKRYENDYFNLFSTNNILTFRNLFTHLSLLTYSWDDMK